MLFLFGLMLFIYFIYFISLLDYNGPLPYPFIGNLQLILEDYKKKDQKKIDKRIVKYGQVHRLYIPNTWLKLQRWVCVFKEEDIQYILKTNFDNYIKGNEQYTIFKDLLGDGIFNTDGEKWKQQRKISSHNFSQCNMRTFMTNIFINYSSRFNKSISIYAEQDKEIDLQLLFKRLTFDIICKIVIGIDMNSVEIFNYIINEDYSIPKNINVRTIRKNMKFNRAFDNVQKILDNRFVSPFWKIKNKLSIGLEKHYNEYINDIDIFIYEIICKLKESKNTNMDDINTNHNNNKYLDIQTSIIDHFIKSGINSDKQLRDIVTNFLLAGRDTTASALTFCFYVLAQRKDFKDRILDELNDREISYDTIKSMKYLNAFITEVLRKYPPIPIDTKIAKNNDILPSKFYIRKNDRIMYSPFHIGNSYLIFDEPEKIKPERWLNNNLSMYKLPIFNAGSRLCLGKEMAYIEIGILICTVLQEYDFELLHKNIELGSNITLYIKDGLILKLKKRYIDV